MSSPACISSTGDIEESTSSEVNTDLEHCEDPLAIKDEPEPVEYIALADIEPDKDPLQLDIKQEADEVKCNPSENDITVDFETDTHLLKNEPKEEVIESIQANTNGLSSTTEIRKRKMSGRSLSAEYSDDGNDSPVPVQRKETKHKRVLQEGENIHAISIIILLQNQVI